MSDPISLAPTTSSERTSAASPAEIYPTTFPPSSDPLKPLLNPTLSDTSIPSSVVVEPPQTPNPANPATDAVGQNTAPVARAPSPAAPPPPAPESSSADVDMPSAQPTEPIANGDYAPAPPAPEAEADDSQPPLPIDAPVPPTPPEPTDEVNPAPPADLIPPAVSTPTVIEVGEPDDSSHVEVPDQVDPIVESSAQDLASQPILDETPAAASADLLAAPPSSLPQPSPSPVQTPAPVVAAAPTTPTRPQEPAAAPVPAPVETAAVESAPPAEVEAEAAPSLDDAMDVDAVGEADGAALMETAPPLQSSGSNGSMKRAGEDLDDSRDEKRIKEDPAPAPAPAAASAPTTTAAPPAGGAALPPVQRHPAYVPAPSRPAGPTAPLTITQHKYLTSQLKRLKGIKEAAIFGAPVDYVAFNIPTYPLVVTKPMDLGTVETKLIVSDPRGYPKDKSKGKAWDESKGKYGSVAEVTEDIRQVWENTRMFNGPDHLVSLGANKLEAIWEESLRKIPPEPAAAPAPAPLASPAAAGPSTTPHARRASISQPPAIRRTSDAGDRPKREIHPPPSKELSYADGARKPKRRLDNQLRWAERVIKTFENKHFTLVSAFLYPVEDIIASIPDYVKHIKKPIDLNHIKRKFAESTYEEVKEVDQDMRLMTDNAMKFNPAGDSVHTAASQLKQLWAERFKEVPPKESPREISEDPLGGDYIDDEDDEDEATIAKLQKQINDLQKRIDDIRDRKSRRHSKGGSSSKTKAKAARKQSVSKASPNGNGPKKGRKKDAYADDEYESEEEVTNLTLSQKQDLAEKIGTTDADTLQKAITIIQQTMNVGSDEEIELDIDSLPPATVVKLYNLVCRGGKGTRRPKGQAAVVQAKKPGRKATGGFGRKSMNEDEEAERISRIEQQLMSFEAPGQGGRQYEESEESSDEEDSDEE